MSIIEITSRKEEDDFINNCDLGVIFFGSKRCGHCINIEPFFRELSTFNSRIKFGHVETTNVKVSDLQGVPVFVGYKKGKCFKIIVGAQRDQLKQMIYFPDN
jgi:Thioredoxin